LDNKSAKFDNVFFLSVIALVAFGFVMDFSSSFIISGQTYGDSFYMIKKHFVFMIMGFVVMMLLSRYEYKKLQKYVLIGFLITLVLLVLTLVPGIGIEVNHARRWIGYKSLRFQTSEFAKYILILFLANYYQKRNDISSSLMNTIIIPLAFLLPMFILIFLQPNKSTAVLLLAVVVAIMFVSGVKIWYLVLTGLCGVPLVIYKLVSDAYSLSRIQTFFDPWKDVSGKGYQVVQSFMAFYSGGFWGVGLGHSKVKLFIPEAHNDFIFAIIGEELGFIGVILVLTAFFILIYRGTRIALRTKDLFGRLLVFGIIMMITMQVIFNLGVVTGLLPATGLALPFVSYGGTALISFMAFMGIVLNVSRSVSNK